MSDTQPVRVMIVDDHSAIIKGLQDSLNMMPGFEVIAAAQTVEEARLILQSNKLDLVIMDIHLHDANVNGIDLTEEFSTCYLDLVILIYSANCKTESLWQAIDAGAGGYLLKGTDLSVIKQAIDTVMAGRIFVDPSFPKGIRPPLDPKLTRSEQSVLRLFAQWMTNEEVSQRLKITLATVRTHRNNIYWKLGLTNAPQLYREAIRRYGNPDDPIY